MPLHSTHYNDSSSLSLAWMEGKIEWRVGGYFTCFTSRAEMSGEGVRGSTIEMDYWVVHYC